jgi:hypothetical protein
MPRRLAEPVDEDLGLSGEQRLVLALLRQTLTDLRSPHHGAAARQFLQDPAQVTFWLHLIGLDSDQFHTYTRAALAQVREA